MNDEQTKGSLGNIAGIYRSLNQVDVMKLKQKVHEVLTMKAVMYVSERVLAVSYRVLRNNLLTVLVPGGGWERVRGGLSSTSC